MESTVLPPILPAKSTGGGALPIATPGLTQNSVMTNHEPDDEEGEGAAVEVG